MLTTQRLRLRPWKTTDLAIMAQMHQDPQVMEYLLGPLSTEQTANVLTRLQQHIDDHGWGVWAVETLDQQALIGMVGLNQPKFLISDDYPYLEVMWRLKRSAWHQGYATEAAEAAIHFAFHTLKHSAIIAFTSIHNQASQRVMQRLNMSFEQEFDHPMLEPHHSLARHMLYKRSNTLGNDG